MKQLSFFDFSEHDRGYQQKNIPSFNDGFKIRYLRAVCYAKMKKAVSHCENPHEYWADTRKSPSNRTRTVQI